MKRGPEIKVPKFLSDLYRDLRDQRLLPIVILLLVAIPVVPIVLGSPTPAFVPPAADEGLASTITDDSLMVVSAPAGLRRYGDRLSDRSPRDPFVDPEGPRGGSSSESNDSAASGGSSTTVSNEPVVPDPTPVNPDPGGSGGSGGGGSGRQPQPVQPADPSITLFRMRTDLRFGKAGSGLLNSFEDVDRMRGFPKQSPIAVFIGASEDGKRAVFSISADASLVSGDGQCSSGRPKDCQFLTLRPGRAANIRDARRGVVWRLAVTSIELVESEIEAGRGRSGKAGRGTGAQPLNPQPVNTASLSEVIGLYLLK
jgi:hypothetical protein